MDAIEKKYIKMVKKCLPLRTENRKEIINIIQKGIHDYILDYQITDYNSLITGFGSPQEIVDHYIDESPSQLRLQRNTFILLIMVFAFLLTGSISIAVSYYYYDNTPSYIIEELPIIIETFPNEF